MHTKVVSTQVVVAAAAEAVAVAEAAAAEVVETAVVEPELAAGHRVQLGVVVGLDLAAPAIGSGSVAAEE